MNLADVNLGTTISWLILGGFAVIEIALGIGCAVAQDDNDFVRSQQRHAEPQKREANLAGRARKAQELSSATHQ